MKIVCGPPKSRLGRLAKNDVRFVLYGFGEKSSQGSAGATLLKSVQHSKIAPTSRAWDLLSLALSVICADTAVRRNDSPDGWTRQIELKVAVSDPNFWSSYAGLIENQLKFLTTDIWQLQFVGDGLYPESPKLPAMPDEGCVTLLSGGLDSFVGAIDLVGDDKKAYAVSQVSTGDKHSQSSLASKIGGGLRHLQLNHNVKCFDERERSQRARSLIFLAYGVLAATALKDYKDGKTIDLYVCENGFISINPPLTAARLGSLSTRTTHPIFISMFQELLDVAGLQITVRNPYQFKTKGDMLRECRDQPFLAKHAAATTSCGRYARNHFEHCGRCLPCLIRRAAFRAWGKKDKTPYVYHDLSKNDARHARFDDVRCAAIAAAQVQMDGIDALPSTNLNALIMGDLAQYKSVLARGIKELGTFLSASGVK
jgi:7-cyano-7-deazaguanine synthase in queuosine biosynthesis